MEEQNPKRQVLRCLVEQEHQGLRLDKFLALQTAELSRGYLRQVIDIGGVQVDGRRSRRCSLSLKAGQRVEVHIDGLPLEPFTLNETEILFRDKYLLVLNKPSGIETQPTHARYIGTLYEALLRFLHDPFRPMQTPPLGMVQRLDRETSGVMVFSIHPRAHKGLTEAFTGREVGKAYLALVSGTPDPTAGEFRSQLARERFTNLMRSVTEGGKEAVTRYRVADSFAQASLVEVELLTGRSHQIRAHFAEAGHPLLGDVRYGGTSTLLGEPVGRQMLHAHRLELSHPVTGERLSLEAPLPADMQGLLERLRGRP